MTTSFKFHFRPSSKGPHVEGKLFIRVIHNRRYKNLSTTYALLPAEWNAAAGQLIPFSGDSPRYLHLKRIQEGMQQDLSRLKMIISSLDQQDDYSVEEIIYRFKDSTGKNDLLGYSEGISHKLHSEGRIRTGRAYRSAARSLIRFVGNRTLKLNEINTHLLHAYEKNLLNQGLLLNTVSFYMRNLRAIYNRAIRDKVIPAQPENPFEKVFTGVSPTVKRALNKEEINSLARLDNRLTDQPVLWESLMYFMFCFHARGMSYVDLAYLRWSEIRENKIIYIRKKSGQQLQVKITPPMRKIINYFRKRNSGSTYVFPIINSRRGDERLQYETGLRMQNKRLHVLEHMAGLKKRVTTHVSRHSWATIAKHELVDITMISEALGHTNVKTTIMYLDSFDRSKMDLLSEKMSRMIKREVA